MKTVTTLSNLLLYTIPLAALFCKSKFEGYFSILFSRKAMTALGRLIGNFDGIFLSVCTEMFAYCCRVGYCVDFKSRYLPIICAVRSKWSFHPGNFFHLDRDWTCCIWQQVYTIFVDHWWQVRIMNHQSGASFGTEAIFRVIALV